MQQTPQQFLQANTESAGLQNLEGFQCLTSQIGWYLNQRIWLGRTSLSHWAFFILQLANGNSWKGPPCLPIQGHSVFLMGSSQHITLLSCSSPLGFLPSVLVTSLLNNACLGLPGLVNQSSCSSWIFLPSLDPSVQTASFPRGEPAWSELNWPWHTPRDSFWTSYPPFLFFSLVCILLRGLLWSFFLWLFNLFFRSKLPSRENEASQI